MPVRLFRHSTSHFLLGFSLAALTGFALEVVPWVDTHAVVPTTRGLAWVAGHLVELAGGSAYVSGTVIRHPSGFAIAIANGCSGLEAVILLAAGMLAFPASWRNRCIGVAAGTAAIMALNLLRIVSLYYLGQYSRSWFEWAHLYAWDILIMIDALVAFLLWVRWLPSERRAREPGAPA
jgi:exosortase H (IPTLxxWG-CTERM-specific)